MLTDERSLFLGVDPGHSGGLAIVDRGGVVVDVSPMPETEADVSEYFREFGPRIRMAAIEAVHSMPGEGVSSSFKFGMSYGGLRMALICHAIPFESVTPQKWQMVMRCLSKGQKKT